MVQTLAADKLMLYDLEQQFRCVLQILKRLAEIIGQEN